MKFVALCALLALAVHSAHGLAQMRTVRRAEAATPVPAPAAAEAQPKVEMVLAEIKSESDETAEDGSHDASDLEAQVDEATAALDAPHVHFRQFTKPMELLPNDHTTLVEVAAREDDGEEGGGDKGSNPTYILPVDPFNYFPFFNGFSNVNPFSQFYPPPPYLYPQYTNYMHQYANHGAGHPPGYPYPGAYGGLGAAYGHGHGGAHAGFPYNYPAAHPHMHYPFGAYKMDVSGPDVRTGSNNPPPFPQFMELAAQGKLITPEIIPKSAEAAAAAEEDGEEEGDVVIASLLETDTEVAGEDEDEAEDLEYESDDAESSDEAEGLEYLADSDSEGSDEAADVEILDEAEEGSELSDGNVQYEAEGADEAEEAEVEYAN